MSTPVIILSDLHISPYTLAPPFNDWTQLISLLQKGWSDETALVLNGDCFDFLAQPNRDRFLDLAGAADFVENELNKIKQLPYGEQFFNALTQWIQSGKRIILIPGNHDPELFHPEVEERFRQFLELEGAGELFSIHQKKQPCAMQVGSWQVKLSHGDEFDRLNQVDVAGIHDALSRGLKKCPLPAGSLFVLDMVQVAKRAIHPTSGKRRFPFIDKLKPEMPGALLLMLYLDPVLTLRNLPGLSSTASSIVINALKRDIRAITSGSGFLSTESQLDSEKPSASRQLATALCHYLPREGDSSKTMLYSDLEEWLTDQDEYETNPGMLAAHNGFQRKILRIALRALGAGDRQFEIDTPSKDDKQIYRAYEVAQPKPTLLVAGHTHAARAVEIADNSFYINTGTWTDIVKLPGLEDPEEIQEWIGKLEADQVDTEKRLTYAEITPENASLMQWTPSGPIPLKVFPNPNPAP
ncbi:MAG: metallophosphoesterase [Magnetococcales bacterium]|nr:metallophosphoesterase [Magnetococcales bacterium]